MIQIVCYNEVERWHRRSNARKFYYEGVMCCEGSERDRYVEILRQLDAGLDVITDGWSLPLEDCEVVEFNTPDGFHDVGNKIVRGRKNG